MRDSSPGFTQPPQTPSKCKIYPKLRELLAQYMTFGGEKIYPKDRKVVEVMDAPLGASEGEVCRCLAHLYNERGLRPGTANGPRTFAWFPTVVTDCFDKQYRRFEMAGAHGEEFWTATADGMERKTFEDMTEAIELPDAG